MINIIGIELIGFLHKPTDTWHVAIPDTLLDPIITWYHHVLSHIGIRRLYNTISTHLYHPALKDKIECFVLICKICQKAKLPGPGYSHLPPRDALSTPWLEVAIDLIGPWSIIVKLQELVFHALTCIDTVTNLAEVIRIENKTAAYICTLFENHWLSHYPRPSRCVDDNGGEFIGVPFLHMLKVNGIKDVTTTIKNPQANAICERLHQTISSNLRAILHHHPPQNPSQANDVIVTCYAAAAYASKTAIHCTLNISPGALVFHRDMILNIPLITDLQQLHTRQQTLIDEQLRQNNFHQ